MTEDRQPSGGSEGLPGELVDRLTRPFARFLRIEAAGSAVLLLFTVTAVILSNSPWAHPFQTFWDTPLGVGFGSLEFSGALRTWINDGLMTLFFFVVSLELKRELVLGELRNPRIAALSMAGALGGMLVPAGLYVALQFGHLGSSGWGTVMATDTAFVVGVLALLGSRIPQSLRLFMLGLAIIDDIGAIIVVALGYGGDIAWGALALAALGIALVGTMARVGLRGFPIYFIVGGLVWLAMDASGIHPTITGVALGLLTPARRWVSDDRLYAILGRVVAHPDGDSGSGGTKDRRSLQLAEVAARESLSPVERLEIALHPWVGLAILPLFSLANAGFQLSLDALWSSVTGAVFVGFVIGKPAGVVAFSWIAVRLGIAKRPPDLGWRLVAGGGLVAGIGFTMALFITNLAFDESLIDNAKMGIFLAGIVSAVAGSGLLLWSTASRTVLPRFPRRTRGRADRPPAPSTPPYGAPPFPGSHHADAHR